MKNLFLLLLISIPVLVLSQDLTGVWTGSMYNDSTLTNIPYEIAISESNGKLSGYSHTTFKIDGIDNIGVKTLRIIKKNNRIFIEDMNLIYNNYSVTPAKGVHMYSLLECSDRDSVLVLSGIWNTNRTKAYQSVTGSLMLKKQKQVEDNKIIPQLDKLHLLGELSFLQQPPKEIIAGRGIVPAINRTSFNNSAPVAQLATRKIETIQTVSFKSDSLVLTLYDNGEVDGDTVTILMNGKVIWPKQGLTAKGINKTLHIPADLDSIQLIMYAENLGSIPPNTGLLVVRDAGNDYEIRFSGDLQKNAAIILKRKKPYK